MQASPLVPLIQRVCCAGSIHPLLLPFWCEHCYRSVSPRINPSLGIHLTQNEPWVCVTNCSLRDTHTKRVCSRLKRRTGRTFSKQITLLAALIMDSMWTHKHKSPLPISKQLLDKNPARLETPIQMTKTVSRSTVAG